jgi:hypothetical protein
MLINLDNPGASLVMWIIFLILSTASVLLGILGVLWPRILAVRACQFLCVFLLLAVFLIQLDQVTSVVRESGGLGLALALQFATLLAGWGLYYVLRSRPRLRKVTVTTGLLVGGATVLTWLMWQLEDPPAVVDRSHFSVAKTSELEQREGAGVSLAWTDLGSPVNLYKALEPLPWLQHEAATLEAEYANRIIRVAPFDPTHSCHGWTFTGGRFFVSGKDVDRILQENGYVEVSDPGVGDVIIYRNSEDQVMHSGVVRLTDGQGMAVIESKWDVLGRYLHAPDVQPYSQQFSYYRSARKGHILAGIETLPATQSTAK